MAIKRLLEKEIKQRFQSEPLLKRTKFAEKNYLKYKDFVWILDDESYFALTNNKINGNDNIF